MLTKSFVFPQEMPTQAAIIALSYADVLRDMSDNEVRDAMVYAAAVIGMYLPREFALKSVKDAFERISAEHTSRHNKIK